MITFDAKEDAYYDNGVRLDRVTKILRQEGFVSYSGIRQDVMDAAANLGNNVHKAVELYCRGNLREDILDPNLRPYLDAFKAFMRDNGYSVVATERAVSSKRWGFAGKLDLILEKKQKLSIWDIKTGTNMHPATALQTAMYLIAAQEEGIRVRERGAIQCRPDGTYRMHIYTDQSDITLAQSIAAVHNGRKKFIKGEFIGIDTF